LSSFNLFKILSICRQRVKERLRIERLDPRIEKTLYSN